VDRFATGDSQHNAGMLDLEPGQVPGSGDRLEDREIRGSDDQGTGFATTHGTTSDAGVGLNLQHTAPLYFLHYLWPGPLGRGASECATFTCPSAMTEYRASKRCDWRERFAICRDRSTCTATMGSTAESVPDH
jgi:hypothetical protein